MYPAFLRVAAQRDGVLVMEQVGQPDGLGAEHRRMQIDHHRQPPARLLPAWVRTHRHNGEYHWNHSMVRAAWRPGTRACWSQSYRRGDRRTARTRSPRRQSRSWRSRSRRQSVPAPRRPDRSPDGAVSGCAETGRGGWKPFLSRRLRKYRCSQVPLCYGQYPAGTIVRRRPPANRLQ